MEPQIKTKGVIIGGRGVRNKAQLFWREMWGWVGVYWYVVRLRGQKWVGGGRARAPMACLPAIRQGQGIVSRRSRKASLPCAVS